MKSALAESPGVLAVMTSGWFFDEVVRHSRDTDPATFRPVRVAVKETSTVGWISLPDHPYLPDAAHLTTPPPREPVGSVPHQLPAAPRSFIGRAEELTSVTAALDTAAGPDGTMVIVAIAGAGGIGKTWLALQWAHRHADRFPDGQLFVDLRGFSPDSTWYVLRSSDGRETIQQYGSLADDVPVAANLSGDPRSEFVIWRRSNGTWYVLRNDGLETIQQYGQNGDITV